MSVTCCPFLKLVRLSNLSFAPLQTDLRIPSASRLADCKCHNLIQDWLYQIRGRVREATCRSPDIWRGRSVISRQHLNGFF